MQAQVGANSQTRLVQRLSWIGDEYVLRYEVVIEREEDGRFLEQHRQFTNASFIEVSLSPGNYRFRVIPYDFLNRAARDSGWVNFEVRPILMPEIISISPAYLYLDENAVHRLTVSGRNIAPNAEIELRRQDGIAIIPYYKYILPDGNTAWLYLDNDQLLIGTYQVFIRNPGNMETRGGTIIITHPEPAVHIEEPPIVSVEKPEPVVEIQEPEPAAPIEEPEPVLVLEPTVSIEESEPAVSVEAASVIENIFVSAALMPILPVYGEEERFFGQTISFGAAARVGVTFKMNALSLGAELAVSWHFLNADSEQAHFTAFDLNLLVQQRLPNDTMALRFRVGPGFTVALPGGPETLSDWTSLHTNIGASFLWLFYKDLYLETGLDYTHWFTEFPSGALRPWIGVGWRF
jgi:hypothetical protein